MRKSGIFLAALLLICALGAGCVYAYELHMQTDVTYQANVAYGDVGETEGITVTERTMFGYDRKVFWNMVCRLGEEVQAEAENGVLWRLDDSGSDAETAISLSPFYWSYSLGLDAVYYGGLEQALAAAAKTVAPGETGRVSINVGDYCDNYPWSVELAVGSTLYSNDGIYSDAAARSLYDAVLELFSIPVPKNYQVAVTMEKDEDGNLVDFYYEYNDYGDIYSVSVSDGDICYFALNCSVAGVALSDMPIGYGIYELKSEEPSEESEAAKQEALLESVKNIRLVYAFGTEENIEILDLELSSDGKKLELYSREDGMEYLSVIDTETWEQTQKLAIGDGEYIEIKDGALTLFFDEEEMLLVAEQEDGAYELISFAADFGSAEFPGGRDAASEFLNILCAEDSMAWDGTRLVILTDYTDWIYPEKDEPLWDTSNFTLCIFERTGLTYLAKYDCSLNTRSDDLLLNYQPWEMNATVCWEDGLEAGF